MGQRWVEGGTEGGCPEASRGAVHPPEPAGAAAQALFPGLPREEALRRMGEAHVDSYEATALGRAVLAALRQLGPHRTLERMTQQLRSGAAFVGTRLERRQANAYALHLRETAQAPTYFQGLVQGTLRAAGARHPRVDIAIAEERGTTFHVEWD